MLAVPTQAALFEPAPDLLYGLAYERDFLTADEEATLLAAFRALPFNEARFQQYTARRRVVRYGEGDYPASYGPAAEEVNPRRPFPEFLVPLRRRVAQWRGVPEAVFVHALVTEYQPGTPIGWHSDAPHFEQVVGISLAGSARMRFRPYASTSRERAPFELLLEPRSAYVMQDEIRWQWQHHIPATRELRYSITFRTLKHGAAR
jgi:alkylated DNA repair dioxygenase AlkB